MLPRPCRVVIRRGCITITCTASPRAFAAGIDPDGEPPTFAAVRGPQTRRRRCGHRGLCLNLLAAAIARHGLKKETPLHPRCAQWHPPGPIAVSALEATALPVWMAYHADQWAASLAHTVLRSSLASRSKLYRYQISQHVISTKKNRAL